MSRSEAAESVRALFAPACPSRCPETNPSRKQRLEFVSPAKRSVPIQASGSCAASARTSWVGAFSAGTKRITSFGRLRGMSPESLKERVDQVLSVLGLESIADQWTSGFSQGERMKTALGRA